MNGPEVAISIVVPHFESPQRLARLMAALSVSDLAPPGGEAATCAGRNSAPPSAPSAEIIIADDGSAQPPEPGEHILPVQMVSQERRGFRAAAVRNLGASLARGSVLVFLDGDMVPEPQTVRRLAESAGSASRLTVGRRRHHQATGFSGQDIATWLDRPAGESLKAGPVELPEPSWLTQGYRQTSDLQQADDTSFRFVISALCAIRREEFTRLGGFDENLVGYGGEDWEFAQRCWLAGLDLRHLPDAVAWHDGPDMAVRDDPVHRVKNAETARLARRLTHPAIRGRGLQYAIPDLAVEVDLTGWETGVALAALESWLRVGDVGVWHAGTADAELAEALDEDARVHAGELPPEVRMRCRYRVRVHRPVLTPQGWEAVLQHVAGQSAGWSDPGQPADSTDPAEPAAEVAHTRWLSLAARADRPGQGWRTVAVDPGGAGLLVAPSAEFTLERHRQAWL